MSDQQKQLDGKLPYYNRVDVKACCEGVARVRHKAIDVIGKYPENMEWPDIPINHFIDATFRHLMEVMNQGVNAIDPETGELHVDALQWNLMVIQMKREGRERCIVDTTPAENAENLLPNGTSSWEKAYVSAVESYGELTNFIRSKSPSILDEWVAERSKARKIEIEPKESDDV